MDTSLGGGTDYDSENTADDEADDADSRPPSETVRRATGRAVVRDVVGSVATVVALYALIRVPVRPLQIPGYLLVVGFDVLEATFGSAGRWYPLWFAAYLLGLGAVGAAVARLLRTLAVRTGRSGWRFGLAGACVVVGLAALAFALSVSVRVGVVSVLLTGGTAAALFAAAALLLGAFES